MDKDRVEGAAKTASGTVKESVGKLTGDQKKVAERDGEQKVGKAANANGGLGTPFATSSSQSSPLPSSSGETLATWRELGGLPSPQD